MANLLNNPEDFTSGWTILSQGVINTNQAEAPDGTVTADELVDDNSGGGGSAGVQQTGVTIAAATQHVYSLFIKPNQEKFGVLFPANWSPPGNIIQNFDALDGIAGSLHANADDAGIIEYEDNWWRPYVVLTTGGDTSGSARIYVAEGLIDNILTACDGSNSIYIWGAVLEEGNYPSDYISVGGTKVLPVGGGRNFITVTRRTADQMNVKQRMAKPQRTLRDL